MRESRGEDSAHRCRQVGGKNDRFRRRRRRDAPSGQTDKKRRKYDERRRVGKLEWAGKGGRSRLPTIYCASHLGLP